MNPHETLSTGFDLNFQDEVPFLTKFMDFLPLVSTKAPSSITVNAEFAQMIPGTSNLVDGKGTSYIDDFESAVTPINLGGWAGWDLAATPKTTDRKFDKSTEAGSTLGLNYKRAKIAWYTVDQSVFYRTGGPNKPTNITDEDLQNHYVRPVLPQEIFRQQSRNLIVTPETLLILPTSPAKEDNITITPT